ncbi:MAG: transporter permease protein, partial [Pseudomonadota bacterium]|jgi:ribose transport system permease protein
MGSVIYGAGRVLFLRSEANYLPEDAGWVFTLGRGQVFGLPISVICFICVLALAHLVLRKTALGLFIYAMGDNPVAARSAGIPARPATILIYIFAGLVAFFAGLLTAGAVNNINSRMFNSTLIYDVLLVVVVGGIGLSGGRGGMKNVLIGTMLIGTLLNGMIILNISYNEQSLIKGVILLLAILADTILNPRDEQTSQQGDI